MRADGRSSGGVSKATGDLQGNNSVLGGGANKGGIAACMVDIGKRGDDYSKYKLKVSK